MIVLPEWKATSMWHRYGRVYLVVKSEDQYQVVGKVLRKRKCSPVNPELSYREAKKRMRGRAEARARQLNAWEDVG